MAAADPGLRVRIARAGGLTAFAKHGAGIVSKAQVARQQTLNDRLCAEFGIDPSTPEGAKRLKAARSAEYSRMSLKRKAMKA